jgi:D-alanine-D-alanine ligase
MGGLSKEREISLRSGRAVATALRAKGYDVVEVDVGRDVAEKLLKERVEVAFIALHGRYGEDGVIQGLLEIMQIPYTGSGPLPSAIGIDKDLTKKLAAEAGIRTPKWTTISKDDVGAGLKPAPTLPVIIKPNREGSTIGMSIVREQKDFQPALVEAAQYDETILMEEFITGTEVTVGILNGRALPTLEIVPKGGFYDYASKYTKGMTEYIIPARISEAARAQVSQVTEKVFSLLKLSGVARMDFIVNPAGEDYFLEVNTIPGMTETSLVPKAAAAAGLSFEDLCEEILKGASLKV